MRNPDLRRPVAKTFALGLSALLALFAADAQADMVYNWTWAGSSAAVASGTVSVNGTQADGGTGSITVNGQTWALALLTATSPGVTAYAGGTLAVRVGGGTDINGFDTYVDPTAAPYVDDNGLTFEFGPVTANNLNPYIVNFADNGIGLFGAGDPLTGNLYNGNAGGTFTVTGLSEVPLPDQAWLLAAGLMSLAAVARRKRAD